MLGDNKAQALNRLKTVRGHLEGVIRMLEGDAYCVEIMKQISALQSSLERVNRGPSIWRTNRPSVGRFAELSTITRSSSASWRGTFAHSSCWLSLRSLHTA